MKILGYNFLSTLLFTVGFSLLSGAMFSGLAHVFPNTQQTLPAITATSTALDNSASDNSAGESPSIVNPPETDISTSSEPVSNLGSDRNVPRIMYWSGKVNQHWDLEKGVWSTDLDGSSGAQLDKLEYCRKFYPTTEKVIEYKKEFDNNWKNGGNSGSFPNTLMSYRCVLSGESI